MIQKSYDIAGIILLIIILVFLFNYGWHKHETIECLTWIQQSKQFPDYYFADWQYEQCLTHAIDLNIIY